MISGVVTIALTKLDVLDELDEIKICTGYRIEGEKRTTFPARDYISRVEELVGAPVGLVSTGPRREETIIRDEANLTRLTTGRPGAAAKQRSA
jgi:adenylosuccinate synthase